MTLKLSNNKEYISWLKEVKSKIYSIQIKAAIAVNHTMLAFYWNLGKDIADNQNKNKWGDTVIEQLSEDLHKEFPEMKGFSRRNLFYMKKWYLFYNEQVQLVQQVVALIETPTKDNTIEKVQQLVGQIPWGHNILIITKIKNITEALFYANETVKNAWSRAVLTMQIETDLFSRQGKAITNFNHTLPKPQSDLARQTLKDPYIFDILTSKGKADELEPEHAGKLALYIAAVDKTLKTENDNQTIGLILCKRRDKIEAEYLLNVINQPIGIAEYEYSKALPKELKSELPSIEDIENELSSNK